MKWQWADLIHACLPETRRPGKPLTTSPLVRQRLKGANTHIRLYLWYAVLLILFSIDWALSALYVKSLLCLFQLNTTELWIIGLNSYTMSLRLSSLMVPLII